MNQSDSPEVVRSSDGLGAGSGVRQYAACKGTNCGCTDGRSHSRECEAEHDIAINGPGRCSVPMWWGGLPSGRCDKPAFGMRPPGATFWNYAANEQQRLDGRYNGYVPHLACPAHGGPQAPNVMVSEQPKAVRST